MVTSVTTVADRITRDIARNNLAILPSRAVLARRYGVSERTVAAAAAKLRDQGVLVYHKGQRMKVRGAGSDTFAPLTQKLSAVERCVRILHDRIADGVYHEAVALPKLSVMAKELGVSTRTLTRALRHPAIQGLVYKQANRWIIGRRREQSAGTVDVHPMAMVIIQPSEHIWRGFYAPRTAPFVSTFTGRAQQYGVQLVQALSSESDNSSELIPAGREQVLKLVSALGERYLGAILAGSLAEIENLERWAAELCRFGPVVWFDRYGEYIKTPVRRRRFIQCRFSEERGVRLALRHLQSMGHTAIGVPVRGEDWELRRALLLQQIAQARNRSIRIVIRQLESGSLSPNVIEDAIHVLGGLGVHSHAAAVDKLTVFLSRSFTDESRNFMAEKKYVAYYAPVVMQLIREGCTAILAPNDDRARHIYYCLRAAGIEIPRRISLLSFDNYPELIPLPVTTVDFGFGYLGYRAFHHLWEREAMRSSSSLALTKPFIVRRGSVAKPAFM